MPTERIFIGWDTAEMCAFNVAAHSLHAHATTRHDVRRVALDELQAKGLYTRPTHFIANGQRWDVISAAPMSTGHAIARFFVPYLCGYEGWALFTDGDVLFREDIAALFALKDERYAVMCVQHPPMPESSEKKAGHIQTHYSRKNWSSVLLFNCGHPSNRALDLTLLNRWPGRDLHAFRWLQDAEVGDLPSRFNYLVNVTQPMPDQVSIAHFTMGTPDLEDHKSDPFAEEWRAVARRAGYMAVPA